jgi:hypothetical protein
VAAEESSETPHPSQPLVVAAEHLFVRLRELADRPAPDVAEVDARGAVHLSQQRPSAAQPLVITGDRVHLQNESAVKQVAHIYGAPAQIRDSDLQIEGQNIHLDRGHNLAWVDGPGLLQRPLDRDLDGQSLPERQMLDVFWSEKMTFDGQLATFQGDARALLGDRQMSCQNLQVSFVDRLSFTGAGRSPQVELDWVLCQHQVHFENTTREAERLTEVQTAEVYELRIQRGSGDLRAQGPGWMRLWRRGQPTRAALGPTQSARANAPMQLDAADWEFTHVTFDGTMTGNLIHRHATFRDDVRIVYGPVKHVLGTVDRDELPKNGGYLQCQELQLLQRSTDPSERPLVELVGQGNAQLEGNGFYALADEISYDQSKKSYVLRAFGRNKARLWQKPDAGGDTRETAMQRIQFNPATRTLRVDGVASGQGGR